jgi:hypothetical protein
MPEIGLSGLMSGDGKRGVGHRPQATAPILDSTIPDLGGRRTVSFDHLVGGARHRLDNGERRPSTAAPHRLMKKPRGLPRASFLDALLTIPEGRSAASTMGSR